MGEFLIELLLGIAEILVEALMEFGIGEVLAAVSRRITVRVGRRTFDTAMTTLEYLLFGLVAGWLSVLVLPSPIVRPARVHGLSLVVSPVLAGIAMSSVGKSLRRRGKRLAPIESFGFGFAFALGMALIRFLFVKP